MKTITFFIIFLLLLSITIAFEDNIKLKLFKLFKDSKTEDFQIIKDYSKGVIEETCKEIIIKEKTSPERTIQECKNITYTYPRIDYQYKNHNGTILGTFI